MKFKGTPAPALGVGERSDETPRAVGGSRSVPPDPEVVAKPTRRQFTAAYRLRILEEAERCTQPGEVGRLLRREGLYSSHLMLGLTVIRDSPAPFGRTAAPVKGCWW